MIRRASFLCLFLLGPLVAGEPAAPTAEAIDRAIGRGLAALRTMQQADGGVGERERTALTGLVVLAHLAAGATPDLPENGPALRRMLGFILQNQAENGYLGGNNGGRMYGHGIACLALADALGTARDDDLDERLRAALVRGLKVTVDAARIAKQGVHRGGWRYEPNDGNSDLSLTGWQLMSLHAARRIGVPVPEDVITAAIGYVRGMVDAGGRVGYENPGDDHPALRGLALLALSLPAGPRDPAVDLVLAHVRAEPPAWAGPWFYYRAYYDAAGLPRADPKLWAERRARLFAILVEHQSEDGTWQSPPGDNESGYSQTYTTAMAVLALCADRRLLPSYQP